MNNCETSSDTHVAQKKHFFKPIDLVIAGLFTATVYVILAWALHQSETNQAPALSQRDSFLAAHVRAALEICNTSMKRCIGGYAKYRPDGVRKHLIVRLDYPDKANPDVLGYAGAAMAYRLDPDGYPKKFEWIVLRDDPNWREKAIEFDEQFFWRPG